MPCPVWKCVPTAISSAENIPKVPADLMADESSVTATKIISKISVSWTHSQRFRSSLFWHLFFSHNSLKLSSTNIRGLCSNFVGCESFLESNSPYILVLCETHLDDWINSGNFSLRDYLLWICKDSVTHMHGLAVCVK